MRSLAGTVVGIVFLVCVTAAGMLGTFLADRDPPLSIISSEVLTPTVLPGGNFSVRFTVFRSRACRTTVDRVMRDSQGQREILPDVDLKAPAGPIGIDDTFIMTLPVPPTFAPGPARYFSTTEFACNIVHGLWPIRSPTRELTFSVAGP